jgi:hypothetical protein
MCRAEAVEHFDKIGRNRTIPSRSRGGRAL